MPYPLYQRQCFCTLQGLAAIFSITSGVSLITSARKEKYDSVLGSILGLYFSYNIYQILNNVRALDNRDVHYSCLPNHLSQNTVYFDWAVTLISDCMTETTPKNPRKKAQDRTDRALDTLEKAAKIFRNLFL